MNGANIARIQCRLMLVFCLSFLFVFYFCFCFLFSVVRQKINLIFNFVRMENFVQTFCPTNTYKCHRIVACTFCMALEIVKFFFTWPTWQLIVDGFHFIMVTIQIDPSLELKSVLFTWFSFWQPTISNLSKSINIEEWTQQSSRLFRFAWFYIIVFKYIMSAESVSHRDGNVQVEHNINALGVCQTWLIMFTFNYK